MAPASRWRTAGRIAAGGSSTSPRPGRRRSPARRIAALYQIEAEIRGKSAAERQAARQLRSKPLVEALKLWLQQRAAELSRKSALAEAIGYALNHWDGLVRFLDDGRIEIDSNTVERSMRPIALNRKNALFAGHDLGADNSPPGHGKPPETTSIAPRRKRHAPQWRDQIPRNRATENVVPPEHRLLCTGAPCR